jgi:hypothetical protein
MMLADLLHRLNEHRLTRLVRHFFGGFFDVEIMNTDSDQHLTLVHILAVLAVPGIFLTFPLLDKYAILSYRPAIEFDSAIWKDKCFFLSYAAAVMGFVTVFQWDTLFLGRRDWVVLASLPLRARMILGAKVISLILFLSMFMVDINIVNMIIFPVAAVRIHDQLDYAVWFYITHAASLLGVSAFVFFFLTGLQGLLMNVLPPRAFRRISPYAQFTIMIALLCMLLVFPKISSTLRPLESNHPLFVYLFPPMWFVGFSQAAIGRPEPLFRELSAIALPALLSVVAFAAAMYLLSYYRHVKRSLESAVEEVTSRRSKLGEWISAILDRTMFRHPLERAVFHFIVKTAFRSRRHWLILAAYAGVGISLVVNALLILLNRSGYDGLSRPGPALLSLPLVLTFFLLAGMRMIFTIPAELRANWVFRITESSEYLRYHIGVRKAMLLLAIIPVLLPTLPLSGVLWDWGTALHHFLYCLALAVLLGEFLLLRFEKIPFTCSYVPGKANLPFYGVGYILAFVIYAYTMSSLEYNLLRRPGAYFFFCGVLFTGIILLIRRRMQIVRDGYQLVYDDRAEPAVTTLGIAR